MKHLLFIAFALGLFTNSFGQDLLVTAKGDTLRCKILSQFWKIFITTLLASSSEDKVKMR